MDINEWTAEKLGVDNITSTTYSGFIDCSVEGFAYKGDSYLYKWTMNDANCRQKAREHFKISSEYSYVPKGWRSYNCESPCSFGEGGTEEESFKACLEGIMKAEIDNG